MKGFLLQTNIYFKLSNLNLWKSILQKGEKLLIIEWIGCSGTGKSTLCEGVYQGLYSSGINVRRPLEIFLGRSIAQTISNEMFRNVVLDFFVLPWSLVSIIKYWEFLKYCMKILNNNYSSFNQKLKLLRSILRKTGLHLFLRSCCNDRQLTLIDEGTVHIAHLIFANTKGTFVSEKEIANFCERVPTPDLIVHIMAPESEVIKRTLKRRHKPIAETSPDSLKQFIILGQRIFKSINTLNPWKNKTVTFSNPDDPLNNDQIIVSNIINQIEESFPSTEKLKVQHSQFR